MQTSAVHQIRPDRRGRGPCWHSTWHGRSLPANCKAVTAAHHGQSVQTDKQTHNAAAVLVITSACSSATGMCFVAVGWAAGRASSL